MRLLKTLKNVIEDLTKQENRQIGKTYYASLLAKKVDGVVVCSNAQVASKVANVEKVKTTSIGIIGDNPRTYSETVYDQDAFIGLLQGCVETIDELQEDKKQSFVEQAMHQIDLGNDTIETSEGTLVLSFQHKVEDIVGEEDECGIELADDFKMEFKDMVTGETKEMIEGEDYNIGQDGL